MADLTEETMSVELMTAKIKSELTKFLTDTISTKVDSEACITAMNKHARNMTEYIHDLKYENRGIIKKWKMDRHGHVVFTTDLGFEHPGKFHRKYYGRRLKRVDAKKQLGTLIADLTFTPIMPVKYITLNLTVDYPDAILADTSEDQG